MRKESIKFGRLAVQSLWAIGFHILFAAGVVGVAYFMTSAPGYVAQLVLDAANGTENAQLAIDYALEDGRALLVAWTLQVFGTGALFTFVFLLFTEPLGPQIEEDARSRRPLWAILMIALMAMAILLWLLSVSNAGIADLLVGSAYVVTGLFGGAFLIMAFHISTATCVKATMQRSVPFSAFLPSIGR
jgi:hypothetical protein